MKTKTTLFAIGLLLMISPVFAQTIDDYLEVARDVLNSEKKAVVAEAMTLSDSESGPFWEMYNEYNAELYKVHTKRVNIIKDFAANYESMSDAKADELWTNSMAYQAELLKLNKAYYKKFKKIVPAGKAALYFQLENKIATLINAELALEIPLVETN
jgi:Skp family chaperone for outer membrane proteins